jgi:hypothetical protein
MRSGLISNAARNGASVWRMNEISRHKSTDVLAGVIREAELFRQYASPHIAPKLSYKKLFLHGKPEM